MLNRRGSLFYLALIMAFSALLLRTFGLSTGEYADRAKAVMGNRETDVLLYNTKGLIYDRGLIPLAGDQPCYYLLVNPRDFQAENLAQLAALSQRDPEELKEKLKKETPFVLKSQEQAEAMPGVYMYEGTERYSGLSRHLIGYLDGAGEVGLAGVEKEYNDYLSLFSSSVKVSYNADAVRGVMAGLGVGRAEGEKTKNGLVLTLDAALCRALEEAMSGQIEKGAAIIMDCRSGEILAATSRPDYEEENISGYLNSSDGELINRAFAAQTVGSVFKIIIAACALEAGLEDFRHACGGGIVIGDLSFACNNHSNDGELGLEEAFAFSCNSYFIALGQLLGYDRIAEMAERFGYGEAISVLGSMTASSGNLPPKSSNMALANLCIGQGDLLASPLQIARMTAAVANGGVLPSVTLYKGLYLGGERKEAETIENNNRILDSEIAEKLQKYCVYTVEKGTGKQAKPSSGSAGGKTSSAQTGIMENGEEKLNVYFTGFYPAEDPRYVITVFAEGGSSGGKTCGPVFREICDFMAENGLTEGKTVVY